MPGAFRSCGGKCARCDGDHDASECPHYPQARLGHADARPVPEDERPAPGPALPPLRCCGSTTSNGGRGQCFFLALRLGLILLGKPGRAAQQLRSSLVAWMRPRPGDVFGTSPLRQWVTWEVGDGISYNQYLDRMNLSTTYAGAPELAAAVLKERVSIWVWAPLGGGLFERRVTFDAPPRKGRVHLCRYDWKHYEHLSFAAGDLDAAIARQIGAAADLPLPAEAAAAAAQLPSSRASGCRPASPACHKQTIWPASVV